jgi:hypothetical protein
MAFRVAYAEGGARTMHPRPSLGKSPRAASVYIDPVKLFLSSELFQENIFRESGAFKLIILFEQFYLVENITIIVNEI